MYMSKNTQAESLYSQSMAEIVWKYVNRENFSHLTEDELLKAQTHFYYQLEKLIVRSILEHADEELLQTYKIATEDEKELQTGFDYEKFDVLFAMAVSDDELMQKVADDIDGFAERFVSRLRRYLPAED